MYRALVGRGWLEIVLLFALAAAAAAYFLPRFSVDAGTNVLLNEDDPDLAYYNITRAEWAYDEYAMVCARRDDWFTPESVKLLADFVKALEGARHVKKDGVMSILKVPLLRNQPPGFAGMPNFIYLGGAKVNLEKARKEMLEHTHARGNLISKDGKALLILVSLDVPEGILRLEPQWSRAQGEKQEARRLGDSAARAAAEAQLASIEKEYGIALAELKTRRMALVADVRSLAREWGPKVGMAEGIRLSGMPIISMNLVEHVEDDIRIFGIASLAFFTLAFLFVYRKLRWTAMPILTCLLPVVLIVGSMAMTGKKVTVITSNLPVLLFVLMLPYTVYFVERYRERRALFASETNLDTCSASGRDIWLPCLYSCTTTQAGFASLLTSGINPVRVFGLMMTIGMGVGLACVFLFLPSLATPLRPLTVAAAGTASGPRGVVRFLERSVLRRPLAIALLSAALLGFSIWGATKIKVETKFIDYFWPRSEIYQGLEYIDQQMGGTTPLEVMLTSKQPGYFKTPEGIAAIAEAERYFGDSEKHFADGVPETGNLRSWKTLLDEARKALPTSKDDPLIRIVLASVGRKLEWRCGVCGNARKEPPKEGEEDPKPGAERARECKSCMKETTWKLARVELGLVDDFCNRDFSVTRIQLRFKETAATLHRKNILDGLEKHLATSVRPMSLEARPTGIFLLYSNMLQSLIQSQKDTFLIVLAAIYLMLVVLFRSFVLSIVVLIPQVLPVFVCLGTMGWVGIPLDLVTVMIASIAMGVGIDAAIQYTVRFRIELAATGGDRRAAVTRSHATIGRSIWIATSIVVAGFGVLSLSKFVPSVYFGLFTALAMLMGQFAALTLLPSLFLLFRMPRSSTLKAT